MIFPTVKAKQRLKKKKKRARLQKYMIKHVNTKLTKKKKSKKKKSLFGHPLCALILNRRQKLEQKS